jgi:hypothetical protein
LSSLSLDPWAVLWWTDNLALHGYPLALWTWRTFKVQEIYHQLITINVNKFSTHAYTRHISCYKIFGMLSWGGFYRYLKFGPICLKIKVRSFGIHTEISILQAFQLWQKVMVSSSAWYPTSLNLDILLKHWQL